jgi:hypothetical protein
MASHKSSQANYVQTRKSHPSRAYSGYSVNPGPVKIVTKALSKFCTGEEMRIIAENYRRSEFTESALLDDFYSANVPHHNVIKDEYYYQALQLAKQVLLPSYKWRPVHFADLRWYNFPLSVSAEAPFTTDANLKAHINQAYNEGKLTNTRISFHNCYNYIFVKCRNWIHRIKEGLAKGNQYFYWITLHARSHLVSYSDPDKIRMVYGVPKLLLLVELMFLWPYFYYLRNNDTVIAWGYETLNGGFYKLASKLDSLKYKPQTWLCLDWSQFDKRARFSVINDVHDAIHNSIEFHRGYVPTTHYPSHHLDAENFSVRMNRLYKWMRNAVKFTPIRIFDGSEYKRLHSNIASGLLSTQLLDTWVNFIMITTCLLSLGIKIDNHTLMKLLGDDSIIALRELILEKDYNPFLERLELEANKRFGAKLNSRKSIIKPSIQGCHFLGYVYDNSIPKRDYYHLLAQLLYPERGWTLSSLAGRAVGIAWASAGQSKLVYNVCNDVYKYIVSLGHTPDSSGLKYLEYQGLTTNDLSVASFPTIEELQRRILQSKSTDSSEYLPSSVFTEKY